MSEFVLYKNQEAICYFNLRLQNKIWIADIIFTNSPIGDARMHAVNWSEIKFVGDHNDEKKKGYLMDHLRFEAQNKMERENIYAKLRKGIKNLLTADILSQKLLWSLN